MNQSVNQSIINQSINQYLIDQALIIHHGSLSSLENFLLGFPVFIHLRRSGNGLERDESQAQEEKGKRMFRQVHDRGAGEAARYGTSMILMCRGGRESIQI